MSTTGKQLDRKIITLVSVVLAVLVAFAGYRSLRRSLGIAFLNFFHPYLSAVRIVSSGVSEHSLLMMSRAELAARVEALGAANRELRLTAQELEAVRLENAELRALLQLQLPGGWRYVPVEIILRDPMFWQEHFTVRIPPNSGIAGGAAVLGVSTNHDPIFVGLISKVDGRSAEVDTLFSSALRISAEFSDGAVGFVNTGERRPPSGTLPIGHLPAHLSYRVGDVGYTTGFERGIPRGVPFGTLISIDEINPSFSSARHLSGLLKPDIDFNTLRFLVVAVPLPPGSATSRDAEP